MVQSIDLPWSMFEKAFASGVEGMRKPDLCFFQHVVTEIGAHPREMIMIDGTAENICAARSQGMRAILVNKSLPSIERVLRNLLQDPLQRAEGFLKDNARNHHGVIEGQEEIKLKDNFAQFMIWELTDDEDIVYIEWPYGRTDGIDPSENGHLNGYSNDQVNGHVNDHLMKTPLRYLMSKMAFGTILSELLFSQVVLSLQMPTQHRRLTYHSQSDTSLRSQTFIVSWRRWLPTWTKMGSCKHISIPHGLAQLLKSAATS